MNLLNQRYALETLINTGVYCEVWKAQDRLTNTPVLIKKYFPAAIREWKSLQLIEREARILAQINHIEIPSLVDFFAVEDAGEETLYLVCYWVRGVSLKEKLDLEGPFSISEALQVASHVLELLIYIHAFQPPVIHRDIKLSNLMVSDANRIFLIDFGGVQETVEAGVGGSTIVGTLGYMAPEQVQGRAVPASDLYSLGVVVFTLLLGYELTDVHERSIEERLKTLDLPEQILLWLNNLTEPNVNKRYANAQDALRDLDHIRQQDFDSRLLFYPRDHQPQLPEIIQRLSLMNRDEKDHSLQQGTLLEGKYRIQGLMGSGAHSRVYAAKSEVNGLPLVIKELCIKDVSEWKNIELFEREVETQKRLRHKRIPDFVDAFSVKESNTLSWFLVTTAVDGETLDEKLQKGWRPSDKQVWGIAVQVLEVLVYLQGLQPPLVHRDIKPSNLVIDKHNQVHLIDFGAVQNRLWSQGGGGSTIIGTFGYMAPEQFSGNAYPQTDLFGLGATLLRMLSGKHPIEMPLEYEGLNFVPFLNCEPFYLQWLRHMLFPLYNKRFDSAQESLTLLTDALSGGKRAKSWLASYPLTQERSAPKIAPVRRVVVSQTPFLDVVEYAKQVPMAECTVDEIHIRFEADSKFLDALEQSERLDQSVQTKIARIIVSLQGFSVSLFLWSILLLGLLFIPLTFILFLPESLLDSAYKTAILDFTFLPMALLLCLGVFPAIFLFLGMDALTKALQRRLTRAAIAENSQTLSWSSVLTREDLKHFRHFVGHTARKHAPQDGATCMPPLLDLKGRLSLTAEHLHVHPNVLDPDELSQQSARRYAPTPWHAIEKIRFEPWFSSVTNWGDHMEQRIYSLRIATHSEFDERVFLFSLPSEYAEQVRHILLSVWAIHHVEKEVCDA